MALLNNNVLDWRKVLFIKDKFKRNESMKPHVSKYYLLITLVAFYSSVFASEPSWREDFTELPGWTSDNATTSLILSAEKGKVTTPIKGATLIGSGPEAMKNVSMVGNDLALDNGVGVCGKDGQSVPVGVGQPTLKVDEMTVGGTQ